MSQIGSSNNYQGMLVSVLTNTGKWLTRCMEGVNWWGVGERHIHDLIFKTKQNKYLHSDKNIKNFDLYHGAH